MSVRVFFPNSLKEAHCCLEQKGEAIHPELLGKEEGEAEDWVKREFPGSVHEGLSRSILPKGSTGALEARSDLHSWATETMKEA
jgi:hypothetical protein